METQVIIKLAIENREGESSYDAKKRLCSLIDSELCHLADHEISVVNQDVGEIVQKITALLDILSEQVSADIIEEADRKEISHLIQVIRNSVMRSDTVVNSESCFAEIIADNDAPYERSYIDFVREIQDLIGNLRWKVHDAEDLLTHERLDQLYGKLWKYSA